MKKVLCVSVGALVLNYSAFADCSLKKDEFMKQVKEFADAKAITRTHEGKNDALRRKDLVFQKLTDYSEEEGTTLQFIDSKGDSREVNFGNKDDKSLFLHHLRVSAIKTFAGLNNADSQYAERRSGNLLSGFKSKPEVKKQLRDCIESPPEEIPNKPVKYRLGDSSQTNMVRLATEVKSGLSFAMKSEVKDEKVENKLTKAAILHTRMKGAVEEMGAGAQGKGASKVNQSLTKPQSAQSDSARIQRKDSSDSSGSYKAGGSDGE